MSSLGENLFGVIKSLNDKIDWFMEHYTPSNLTISGTTTLGANTTIGASDSDVLTVNAQATFNNGLTADEITVDTLTIRDNTTIGQDDSDSLTVFSTSTFETPVIFNSHVTLNENVEFGTDSTNTVVARGEVTAPHFTIPLEADNSLRFGSDDIIIYHEYDADGNIYSDYPGSLLVKVKNIHVSNSIAIIYNSSGSSISLVPGGNMSFIKSSTTAFTRVY